MVSQRGKRLQRDLVAVDSDHDEAGLLGARRDQKIGFGDVAIKHPMPVASSLLHSFRVGIEHDEIDTA